MFAGLQPLLCAACQVCGLHATYALLLGPCCFTPLPCHHPGLDWLTVLSGTKGHQEKRASPGCLRRFQIGLAMSGSVGSFVRQHCAYQHGAVPALDRTTGMPHLCWDCTLHTSVLGQVCSHFLSRCRGRLGCRWNDYVTARLCGVFVQWPLCAIPSAGV